MLAVVGKTQLSPYQRIARRMRSTLEVLMGGSVKGGQVVGRTDTKAAAVEDRPASVADFMATICRILGIDYRKEYDTPGGRPMPLVAKEGRPVGEVFQPA
jgi:hypothetical protein